MAIKLFSGNKDKNKVNIFLKTMVEKKDEVKTVRTVSIILHFRGKLKGFAWVMCP